MGRGMGGVRSVTGEGCGRPPMKCGVPVTDITAGILAAMGVLAAYVHRLKTGEGQRVDTSLFEAAITHTCWQSAIDFATGVAPGPTASAQERKNVGWGTSVTVRVDHGGRRILNNKKTMAHYHNNRNTHNH